MSKEKTKSQSKIVRPVLSVVNRAIRLGALGNQMAVSALTRWFTNMWNGNEEADFRTPLFSKKTDGEKSLNQATYQEITGMYDSVFRKGIQKVKGDLKSLILDMEVGDDGKSGQRAKIGPKSLHLGWPHDGEEKVAALFAPKKLGPNFDEKAWEKGILRMKAFLPRGSIKLSSLEQAIRGRDSSYGQGGLDSEGMDITTNSGLPFVISPWKPTKALTGDKLKQATLAYDYIISRASAAMKILMTGASVTWNALTGQRLVSAGLDWRDSKKKKRLIIAVEKSEPVIWKTFTTDLYDALRPITLGGVPIFVAWSDPVVIDHFMQVALQRATDKGYVIVSGDVSSFDQSIHPKLLQSLGGILDYWIAGNTKLGTGLTKSMSEHTRVFTPGRIWSPAPMGMLSGSGGTNLMDSLYNLNVLFYGEARGYYKIDMVCVQGDDFLVGGEGVNQEIIEQTYAEVGMEAHKDKQLYEPNALNYLQKLHYRGVWGGISSTYRTLASALTYERMSFGSGKWNAYVDIVRNLSQLENTAFHPCFEDLVGFVKSGDKYELGAGMHPQEVMKLAGSVGQQVFHQDVAGSWKSGHDVDKVSVMAVNGVIRGEKLPPFGSRERFLRVYSHRVKKIDEITSKLREVA